MRTREETSIVASLRRTALRSAGRVVDFILPPQCLACAAIVTEPGRLCAECWREARFIAAPYCSVCGAPLPGTPPAAVALPVDMACGACLVRPPAFTRARSVLVFEGAGRDLVHLLKYADRMEGAPVFAAWMLRAAAEAAQDASFIVPVPLHYFRLVRRRYNQAQLLAAQVARATGVPLASAGLKRIRHTKRQVGLKARERAENVRGAFQVSPRFARRIDGAKIILVDDVLTTGATVSACASALKRAGAAEITVLTLARADGTKPL